MPEVEITKFKARRGTDQQRKTLVFDQGEFIYTTDTKRLFIGDGATTGGVVAGAKVHPNLMNSYSLTGTIAEVGDIVPVNNTFWQLVTSDYTKLSSWETRILNVDPIVFSFDSSSTLQINQSSLSAGLFDPYTVRNGVKVEGGFLEADYVTNSIEISASKLSLKAAGLTEREIASSTLTGGLSGGSSSKIGLYADFDHFYFDTNGMTKLSGFNPFTLRFQDLDSDWFGDGLFYNTSLSTLSARLTDVDDSGTLLRNSTTGKIGFATSMFGKGLDYDSSSVSLSTHLVSCDYRSIVDDADGNIRVNPNALSGTSEWPKITVDIYGRVTSHSSSIFQALTGDSSQGSNNVTNSLSSIFNGDPSGSITNVNITKFDAISADGQVVSLSSAGWLTFEGGVTTRMGQSVGRFAIPIYTF